MRLIARKLLYVRCVGLCLCSQLANFSQFWVEFCHLWDQCKLSEIIVSCVGDWVTCCSWTAHFHELHGATMKECRAFFINICPLPNWIPSGTIASPHPYMKRVNSQQISVAACKIDLKICISKPNLPWVFCAVECKLAPTSPWFASTLWQSAPMTTSKSPCLGRGVQWLVIKMYNAVNLISGLI